MEPYFSGVWRSRRNAGVLIFRLNERAAPLSFSRIRSWISVIFGVRFATPISHLVKQPDFDLDRSRQGIGAALDPGDRLVYGSFSALLLLRLGCCSFRNQ